MGTSERYRHYNLGARIPLLKGETCVATAQHRVEGVLRFVKMRLADSAEAERSEYEMRPNVPQTFRHLTVVASEREAADVLTALEAALHEAEQHLPEQDPQAVFWTFVIWRDASRVKIPLEMQWGRPARSAPAFARAWSYLAGVFGVTPDLGEGAWIP